VTAAGTGAVAPAAGGAPAAAPVRRLPGPFATRACVPVGDGYEWREERASGLAGLLEESALAALAGAVPRRPCPAAVPRLVGDAALWGPVPSPWLAFDVVFGPVGPVAGPAGRPGGDPAPAFRRLGEFLAALHRTPVPAALADPPGDLRPRVRPRDAQLRARRAAARAWLAGSVGAPTAAPEPGAGPRPDEIAAGRAAAEPRTARVLTHGRFSLGVIAWADRPVVLGWREAGPGAATDDVDTLLAELVEAAAVAPDRAGAAGAWAAGFVDAYAAAGPSLPAGGAPLADRLRARVLDHLALRAAVTGDRAGPLALLRRVHERLDDFCAPLAARLARAANSGGCG